MYIFFSEQGQDHHHEHEAREIKLQFSIAQNHHADLQRYGLSLKIVIFGI